MNHTGCPVGGQVSVRWAGPAATLGAAHAAAAAPDGSRPRGGEDALIVAASFVSRALSFRIWSHQHTHPPRHSFEADKRGPMAAAPPEFTDMAARTLAWEHVINKALVQGEKA